MKLPFHLVIEFAKHTYPNEVQTAYNQFFSPTGYPTEEQEQDAFPLLSEWLIFDFNRLNKSTFLAEYFLKNPDQLDEAILNQIKQVIKTQWYGGFQIGNRKKGEWFEAEHLFSGKKVIIYDKQGSASLPDRGMIIGRVAKVDGRWYLVGSNPLYLPTVFTPRMKKIMHKNKDDAYLSPQKAWELLKKHYEPTPTPPKITFREILQKRKEIETNYKQIAEEIPGCMSFAKLIKLIYEEDGRPPLDYWQKIIKFGLPAKIFIENTNLFNDIWNYFPHKILNNECPVALYNKLSGKGKK